MSPARREEERLARLKWWDANPKKVLLQSAKRRAQERELAFTLTEDDVVIPDRCPALGIPLFRSRGAGGPNSPTLDRCRPELGYVPGNIRVISGLANRIKADAEVPEQLEAVAAWMRETSCHAA
jgi:hypothetical protein